jgi:hypothetical protein
MSLLITSSLQSESSNQANQYRNNIKNPLIIKKDSQIAVESVKIERSDLLDFENALNTFFWFGERLETGASYDEAISYMIPQRNEIKNSLSPLDFAEEFKNNVLRPAYSLHPELKSNASFEMNPTFTATGAFNAFQYKIPQFGADATSIVPPNDTTLQFTLGSASYSSGVIEATDNDTHVQLQPQYTQGGPLSLHNGSLTFSSITVNDTFVCGLARPIIDDDDGAPFQYFSGFRPPLGLGDLDTDFYDYAVEVSDANGIRAYHSVPHIQEGAGTNQEAPTQLAMREIIYYQKNNGSFTANNGSNSSFATGSPIPSASLGDITFTATGEKMKISVSGNTLVEVNVVNASTKDQIPKPIGQTCWKLYPTVSLAVTGDSCDITNYSTRTSTDLHDNIPENNWVSKCLFEHATSETQDDGTITNFDTEPPWLNAAGWPTLVDFKDCYQPYQPSNDDFPESYYRGGTLRDYKGLLNQNIEDYENIFIMGKSDRYVKAPLYVDDPNSAKSLGFRGSAINSDSGITHSGGYHGASFASANTPETTSSQSTFIRVPTFTHETYNFATGNPSKILFQLPKFDNSGNQSGSLYYQNSDKFFIDLNNTTDIRVTDLDVHFVRKSERFVNDLTGSSEVVFCIREKPKM